MQTSRVSAISSLIFCVSLVSLLPSLGNAQGMQPPSSIPSGAPVPTQRTVISGNIDLDAVGDVTFQRTTSSGDPILDIFQAIPFAGLDEGDLPAVKIYTHGRDPNFVPSGSPFPNVFRDIALFRRSALDDVTSLIFDADQDRILLRFRQEVFGNGLGQPPTRIRFGLLGTDTSETREFRLILIK